MIPDSPYFLAMDMARLSLVAAVLAIWCSCQDCFGAAERAARREVRREIDRRVAAYCLRRGSEVRDEGR